MDHFRIEACLFSCIQRLIESEEGRCSIDPSRGELLLLWYIRNGDNMALPGELSRAMHVSTARIARLLNTLETRGYIRRSKDPADHRRIIVALTPLGQAHVEAVYSRIQGRISAIVEAMGEKDTEEFLRLAERMISISEELTHMEKGNTSA